MKSENALLCAVTICVVLCVSILCVQLAQLTQIKKALKTETVIKIEGLEQFEKAMGSHLDRLEKGITSVANPVQAKAMVDPIAAKLDEVTYVLNQIKERLPPPERVVERPKVGLIRGAFRSTGKVVDGTVAVTTKVLSGTVKTGKNVISGTGKFIGETGSLYGKGIQNTIKAVW